MTSVIATRKQMPVPEASIDRAAADKALSKAKIALMSRPDSAFFTTLCFSLKHLWNDNIPTARTAGTTIEYSTKFFMELSPAEQIFLVLHECLHIAYLHGIRFREGMNHRKANIAMDHVINLQLIAAGFTMPKMGYADSQYIGMPWEEVYKLLPDDQTKPMMEDVEPRSGDGSSVEGLTQEVQDILVRASIQSKMAGDKPGSIPGDIQIFLNGLLNPKLPWQRLVQKFLTQFAKNDYSFKKPNRRFFPRHYLPSLQGSKLMDLACAVDISGSVSDSDFHRVVSEVASLLRMMKPDKITLLQFDTEIKSVDVVKNIQELMRVKFTGRGGTAIEPVITWAQEHRPQLLLVFSDGEFPFRVSECSSTTLWLIHDNERFAPPFGKAIHYSMKD